MLFAVLAAAAPVVCDPVAAQAVLAEARIDESRVSETHPWLVPGLALASADTSVDLRAALDELCAGSDQIAQEGSTWRGTTWSAHSLRLSRTELRGCALYEQAFILTVGRRDGQRPQYGLQTRLPWSRTPVGDCAVEPTWREEQVVAGDDGPVRVVVAIDREGEVVRHSEIRVRRATPAGWHDEVLAAPAPARYLGGFEGPRWAVAPLDDDWVVVASQDRSGTPDSCEAMPGQQAWTWSEGAWVAHGSNAARSLLAAGGLWRLTGEDGWVLVLNQADEDARATLQARTRRLEQRLGWSLLVLPSSRFPDLTPGFLVTVPPPYSSRAAAQAARAAVDWRARSYIKQAWSVLDPCAAD
jgi:hypothetical protein